MNKLFLATEKGLVICERKGDNWHESTRGLTDYRVTSVTACEGLILAGTKKGVFRSDDEGQTWAKASKGLTTRYVRWMAHHPNVSNLAFAGTEPANIFISHDGGDSWRACLEVAELRDNHKWFLPYSPEAGCIRGFAFHRSHVYAAAEVGGALVSDDKGETWSLAEGSDGKPSFGSPSKLFIHPDVHSIEVHPSSPDLVYAPTGGGFYRSFDGGKTWELLYECYCRAVWVDPNDSEHLILSPADGVDRNGRIEESKDGGQSWSMASSGLQIPWRRGMVERFLQVENDLLAVLSIGHLLSTSLSTLNWKRILSDIDNVNAATIFSLG